MRPARVTQNVTWLEGGELPFVSEPPRSAGLSPWSVAAGRSRGSCRPAPWGSASGRRWGANVGTWSEPAFVANGMPSGRCRCPSGYSSLSTSGSPDTPSSSSPPTWRPTPPRPRRCSTASSSSGGLCCAARARCRGRAGRRGVECFDLRMSGIGAGGQVRPCFSPRRRGEDDRGRGHPLRSRCDRGRGPEGTEAVSGAGARGSGAGGPPVFTARGGSTVGLMDAVGSGPTSGPLTRSVPGCQPPYRRGSGCWVVDGVSPAAPTLRTAADR